MDSYNFDQSWSFLTARADSASGRFVLFTKIHGACLIFNCTDGVNLWQVEINEDDLKMKVNTSGISSTEEFLSKIKIAMEKPEVQVSILPQTLTAIFGSKPDTVSLDLFETTAQEKKEGLKVLLFTLVDQVKTLENKLEDATSKLKSLGDSSKAESPSTSPFKNYGNRRMKMASRPKQTKGQSVINPRSKRRAAAKGVVFE